MSIDNSYDKYKRGTFFPASKEEFTLMLFDSSINNCIQAIDAIENREMQKAHDLITEAEEIIEELQSTLNLKYEISKNFYSLCEYMLRKFDEANINKNVEILVEVRDLLREFKDTWKGAINKARQKEKVESIISN